MLPASDYRLIYTTVSPSLLQPSSHSILDPQPVFSFSQLPPLLHTLELDLFFHGHENYMDASGPGGLFNYVLPYLCTLILDHFDLSDPSIAKHFWKAHPGIERLELGPFVKLELRPRTGSWFDKFESGMLPNLRYLKVILYHRCF